MTSTSPSPTLPLCFHKVIFLVQNYFSSSSVASSTQPTCVPRGRLGKARNPKRKRSGQRPWTCSAVDVRTRSARMFTSLCRTFPSLRMTQSGTKSSRKVWSDSVKKCSAGESQQEGAAAAAPAPVDCCLWCQQKISEKELSCSRFCKACGKLRVQCQKCSTATRKNVFKPLRTFSFERSVCQRRTSPHSFNPVELRSLEAAKQIYLAVCDDCKLRSSSEGQALEKRVKCKTCQRELPLAAFGAGTRRDDRYRGWNCWDCQHPVCSGAGCEVRQPIPRVGYYTCPACSFPPCQVCKTTPRPQSTKYTYRNMPAWTCKTCAGKGAA